VKHTPSTHNKVVLIMTSLRLLESSDSMHATEGIYNAMLVNGIRAKKQ